MDRSEVEEIKKTIVSDYTARIEKLKEEMKAELSALSRVAARIAKTDSAKKAPVIRYKGPGLGIMERTPTASERILAAKKVLKGIFTRKDLHDAVNNDGYGEMKEGTFSPYVSRLVAKGEIVEVEKSVGTAPGAYIWSEERKEFQGEPSSLDEEDIPL
jgi:hypothetical protein